MKIGFRRVEPGDDPAIVRASERLRQAGLDHLVGGEPVGAGEPCLAEQPIIERMFVAVDGEEIRGSVWLKEQHFWSPEGQLPMGWMIYPLSESLLDKRFAGVPGTLLFGLLRQQPRLMALGMGGAGGPFTRLLEGARWSSALVPFWFRVLRPARFLRRLAPARSTAARRLASDLLVGSGAAGLGHALLSAGRRVVDRRSPGDYAASSVPAFGDWADAVWERSRDAYALAAVRDARALNALYPPDFAPLRRLRVQRGDRDLGWACTQVFASPETRLGAYFGDARVGVLTDCFGGPDDAADVVDAGVRSLVEEGVDVIVTNQSQRVWCAALRGAGFWKGPSNLAFSWSPAAEKLVSSDPGGFFLTRSDGDGPLRHPTA